MARHAGGCHCGRVRFEIDAPARPVVLECNCSICTKSGYLHLMVPAQDFRLLSGGEVLASYTFETRTALHLFCSVCGIKSFYQPRADPWHRSVNARCLDAGTIEGMEVRPFNGREWGRDRQGPPDVTDRLHRGTPGTGRTAPAPARPAAAPCTSTFRRQPRRRR